MCAASARAALPASERAPLAAPLAPAPRTGPGHPPSQSSRRVVVSKELAGDMRFVRDALLARYNGRSLGAKVGRWHTKMLETDASSGVGYGWCWLQDGTCHKGVWGVDGIGVGWHEDGAKWHINVMELYAVVHAMRHIAHKAINACVHVQVDNTVTKGWLRKCGGTEGVPTTLLRELALILLEANSFLEVVWVASAINKRADALSREDMVAFREAWEEVGMPVVWV